MNSWLSKKKREEGQEVEIPEAVDINTLNPQQRAVFTHYVEKYRKILEEQPLEQQFINIDGTAGCGETYLIRAICQELRRMADEHGAGDPIRVLAPSGVAALNLHGRTVHSLLGLPINTEFVALRGGRLASFQELWQGVLFVIIDEKSMLGLRALAQIYARLRQIIPSDSRFGGLNVALGGNFAQPPPVGDSPIYGEPSKEVTPLGTLSCEGKILYNLFIMSFELIVVIRQQGDSQEQKQFRELLRRASCEGGLSMADWQLLQTRDKGQVSGQEMVAFNNALCVYTTRDAVTMHNLQELAALQVPCAKIVAKHDGGAEAAQAPSDRAGGLEASVILGKGARVIISRNIWQEQGFVNATTGVVEDVVWEEGAERSDLPLVVLVSYLTYKGPTLWRTEPQPGFPDGVPIVPIAPVKTTWQTHSKTCSQTQLPLRLAWAVTVHKSQGLTIPKMRPALGRREFSSGLTFVALS